MSTSSKSVELLYGQAPVTLRVPESAEVLVGGGLSALRDPVAAVNDALAHPIGAPPLRDLIASKPVSRVAITVSDITRPVPYRTLLPPLLDVLAREGVGDDAVTLIVGTGMHRPSTQAEKVHMLGEEVVARYEVVDHRADDPDSLITVTSNPTVRVCRRFVEADLRIVTGLIEPHFMAGFSGGRKGVCPALVDLATVQRFHGYETLSDPGAENGVLAGNPCHEIALEIARLVGVDFLVNAAITRDRRLAGVFAGDVEEAHLAGCRAVEKATCASVEEPFDLVITNGGGHPLDQTFYQTVKGMCTALPALGPGSTLLQLSACEEGVGSDAYRDLLLAYGKDWRRFLRDIDANREQTALDQWEFQMQCRVLERIGIEGLCFVTDRIDEDSLGRLALSPVRGRGSITQRAQSFVDTFVDLHPHARIAVLPEGPYTLLNLCPP